MEGRVIEYRPIGGLDYHNSPLIGEIPTGDYQQFHRSIDQLRSLNERGILVPQITTAATTLHSSSLTNSAATAASGTSTTQTVAPGVIENDLIQDFKSHYNTANFVVGISGGVINNGHLGGGGVSGSGGHGGDYKLLTQNGVGLIETLNGVNCGLIRQKIRDMDKNEEKYLIQSSSLSNRSSPSVLTEGRRQRKPKVRTNGTK